MRAAPGSPIRTGVEQCDSRSRIFGHISLYLDRSLPGPKTSRVLRHLERCVRSWFPRPVCKRGFRRQTGGGCGAAAQTRRSCLVRPAAAGCADVHLRRAHAPPDLPSSARPAPGADVPAYTRCCVSPDSICSSFCCGSSSHPYRAESARYGWHFPRQSGPASDRRHPRARPNQIPFGVRK